LGGLQFSVGGGITGGRSYPTDMYVRNLRGRGQPRALCRCAVFDSRGSKNKEGGRNNSNNKVKTSGIKHFMKVYLSTEHIVAFWNKQGIKIGTFGIKRTVKFKKLVLLICFQVSTWIR